MSDDELDVTILTLEIGNSLDQSSSVKSVDIQAIREISKNIYNVSYLININDLEADMILEKLKDAYSFMSNFIDHSKNLPVLHPWKKKNPELPRQWEKKIVSRK